MRWRGGEGGGGDRDEGRGEGGEGERGIRNVKCEEEGMQD